MLVTGCEVGNREENEKELNAEGAEDAESAEKKKAQHASRGKLR
jgi:hypothetical protein